MNDIFKIYKVDRDEVIRIDANENLAHEHNFEELIIGLEGGISHFIDYKSQVLEAPFISFVTKGKIHRVNPTLINGKCDFWVIRFKSEFISQITFLLYNYYHENANFQFLNATRLNRIDRICQVMYEEYQCDKPDLAIIKDLLSAVISMIESERNENNDNRINQNTTFQNFLFILEENFRRSEGVQFYAEKLFMSPKSLNNITQNILHQTVSEIIETRKLIEAKNLLFSTDKSIAEIGFEIGYQDKAYFTALFKKKSGQTPSEFREEIKNSLS